MDDKKGHHDKFQIFVNGQHKTWEKETISYTEVINLANPSRGENDMFTVTYEHGQHNSKGTLVKGQEVEVKDGMKFYVEQTGMS